MPDVFPGISVLQLANIHKNIADGAAGGGALISKVRIFISPDRITGPTPAVYVRASASGTGSFEEVTGDVTAVNGYVHTLTTPGAQIDLRLIGSGTILNSKDSEGKVWPVILVKVEEYT